jgi:hypothetical protein
MTLGCKTENGRFARRRQAASPSRGVGGTHGGRLAGELAEPVQAWPWANR